MSPDRLDIPHRAASVFKSQPNWRNGRRIAVAAATVTVLLAIWQWSADAGLISKLLFPPPTMVGAALSRWARSGALLVDLEASLLRVAAGLALGAVTGVALGLITGRVPLLRDVLSPVFNLLRPLPPVAIIPLIILWLGIGEWAKVFSIAFGAFFPIWLNTHVGVSGVADEYLRSAKIFSTSRLKTVFSVIVPASLPAIYAGLRVGIATSFVMVYVAEFAGASEGIGYEISISYLGYQIDLMLAAMLVLALAGAISDLAFSAAMAFAFPWLSARRAR